MTLRVQYRRETFVLSYINNDFRKKNTKKFSLRTSKVLDIRGRMGQSRFAYTFYVYSTKLFRFGIVENEKTERGP